MRKALKPAMPPGADNQAASRAAAYNESIWPSCAQTAPLLTSAGSCDMHQAFSTLKQLILDINDRARSVGAQAADDR